MEPFLSIVVTGRNDSYSRDFQTRFFRTLRFNHHELSVRGIAHEFVLVEWAPLPDRALLSDLVASDLPEVAASAFRSYIVDARYHEALTLNPALKYLEFVAKNVGIRRARGAFILSTNCDICLSREVLSALQRPSALRRETVYRAPRRDLKEELAHTELTWDVLEDAANVVGPILRLKPPLMPGATGDFVLCDRATFHRLRGFDEIYRVAGLGVDSTILVKAAVEGIAIADIGGPVYHINHEGSYRTHRAAFATTKRRVVWVNKRHGRGLSYDNPENWGLGNAPVSELRRGRFRLEFTWDAVPPLVDLKRLIPPMDPPCDA